MTEYSDMMAEHDAREGGVYLVEVFDKEKFIQHGIFSNSEKAREWIHALPNHLTCICAPFVLDHPDLGTVKKEDMQ